MTKPLIEMRNISKSFGSVKALEKFNLTLGHGEILGLIGDNAAGKSTALKILAGVYIPDEGEIFFDGFRHKFRKPMDARKLGIETIYQDLMLADNLDITKNIFLGRERTKILGFLDKRYMDNIANKIMSKLTTQTTGTESKSVRTQVNLLSGGLQQIVSIGRAVIFKPRVLIMDEPTASLSMNAIERCISLVLDLKKSGCSIIYVTHRLIDILTIADRIVVLKAGKLVAELKPQNTSIDEMVKLMTKG